MAGATNPNAVHAVLTDYSSAAVTAGTNKREWTAPFHGRIVAVYARAETAGSGTGSTTIDVNIGGTSALDSVLSLGVTSTGRFSGGSLASDRSFRAGDRISYDIDSIPTTTGHARVSIVICLGV